MPDIDGIDTEQGSVTITLTGHLEEGSEVVSVSAEFDPFPEDIENINELLEIPALPALYRVAANVLLMIASDSDGLMMHDGLPDE